MNLVWASQDLATVEHVLKKRAEFNMSVTPGNSHHEELCLLGLLRSFKIFATEHKFPAAFEEIEKYEIWSIITSKQTQHLPRPESSKHLWFPSSRLSMQTLHTSQWKDVSLYQLKNSLFKLNDWAITSLTLFQAGGCFTQSKNHWNVLCKGKTSQCAMYRLLRSIHLRSTFWK